MQRDSKLIDAAQKAANSIRVMKGEYASIATCDAAGNPNVAPIGSMRIVDAQTVHVLQGFLPRTYSNLKENPRAVFAVRIRESMVKELVSFNKPPEKEVLGYRVYGRLERISDSTGDVQKEVDALIPRVPWLFRKPFRKFCDTNLKRLWVFSLDEVRPIGGVR